MKEIEEEEMPDAGEEKDACSRRPDGAAINSLKKMLYSLQFTRTTDQRADFEERARGRADRQYDDAIGGLTEVGRSMGRGWSVRLLTLVGGTSASVHKKRLQEHLEELQVRQSMWNRIGDKLVRRLLEEQDTVFECYYTST